MANSVRQSAGVYRPHVAENMVTFYPAPMDCPNANLRPMFRPRDNYSNASLLSSASTISSATLQRHPSEYRQASTVKRSASSGDSNIVWEHLQTELGSAGKLTQSPSTRRKVLVVVPGLGETYRVNLTLRSLETLRNSVEDDDGFACIVYVFEAGILEEVELRMRHLCEIVPNVGMWTSHMKKVPPLTNPSTASPSNASLRHLTENVTHVAIMMDDMDVADLDLSRFVALMEFTGFGVASPAVPNEYYEVMRPRCECVYHRTDFINILFTVFTRRVWQCWQALIDPIGNRHGWGMVTTLSKLCNTTAGVLDVFDTYHRGSSRTYSSGEAGVQMVEWLVKHAKVKKENEKRYRDCVTIHRPAAVFPQCELYWDGTHHSNETHALAPDWDCASEFQR